MPSADFVHLRKGHAYFERPGLFLVGFAGNHDSGYSHGAGQLRQAGDWVCFLNSSWHEQAQYLPASWSEVLHIFLLRSACDTILLYIFKVVKGFDHHTGTDVSHSWMIAEQVWQMLDEVVRVFSV